MSVTEKLFEWFFGIILLGFLLYPVWRWLRPKTTRELLGRPTSFFERLQPTVEAYGDAETSAERDELRADAERAFDVALRDHRLSANDFRLELSVDELGLAVACIHRTSDAKTFTLLDFDDHLLSKPLPAKRS